MRVRAIGASLLLGLLFALMGCVSEPIEESEAAPSQTASERASVTPTSSPIAGTSTAEIPATVRTCDVLAQISWRQQGTEWTQVAVGTPFDGGERERATGTAHLDAEGDVIGYTVAAGDAPSSIGDRFCIGDISVLHFNGYWVTGDGKDIAPGDYLYLAPDPRVPNPNLWAPGTRGP
jgi:hypothetical protein